MNLITVGRRGAECVGGSVCLGLVRFESDLAKMTWYLPHYLKRRWLAFFLLSERSTSKSSFIKCLPIQFNSIIFFLYKMLTENNASLRVDRKHRHTEELWFSWL